MAVTIQQISPVAHLPLVLGVVRKLNVATLIDTFCPPHPAHVLACGRGVEALLLAILDGHHALYKVGVRLEEREMVPLLQPGLVRASLHAYRLGQRLGALFAAHLNRVYGAIAGLDQGIGHFMLCEVDSAARAPTPRIPVLLQTWSVASDRKSAPLPSSRQAG